MSNFRHTPIELAQKLEKENPGTRTLFTGNIGNNSIWAFDFPDDPDATPGVAIASHHGGQVVVNIHNLRELVSMMDSHLK